MNQNHKNLKVAHSKNVVLVQVHIMEMTLFERQEMFLNSPPGKVCCAHIRIMKDHFSQNVTRSQIEYTEKLRNQGYPYFEDWSDFLCIRDYTDSIWIDQEKYKFT